MLNSTQLINQSQSWNGSLSCKIKWRRTLSHLKSGSISRHSFFSQLTSKKHKGIRFSLGQGGPTHGSLCVCWKLQLPAGVLLQPRDLVRSPPGPQVTEHWPHADHGVKLLPASKMHINCSNPFSMVWNTNAFTSRYLKVYLSAFAAFESHAIIVLFCFNFSIHSESIIYLDTQYKHESPWPLLDTLCLHALELGLYTF